jgi:hypothetical protein
MRLQFSVALASAAFVAVFDLLNPSALVEPRPLRLFGLSFSIPVVEAALMTAGTALLVVLLLDAVTLYRRSRIQRDLEQQLAHREREKSKGGVYERASTAYWRRRASVTRRGTLGDAARRGQPPTLSPGRQVVARAPFPKGLAPRFPRVDTGGRTVAFPLLIRTGVASPAPDERRHPVRRRRPGQPHRVRGALARAPSPVERAPEYTGVSRPCREKAGGARPPVTGSEGRPGAG